MSKTICGIKVDEKYYKEFMERSFKVLDKNVKANVVEIYATSRDYAENAPEYAESAQKVREQIRAEIEGYYAAKDGRKEYKAMKHQNFGGYLGDLKELFLQASKERETLMHAKEKALEKWNEEQKEYRGDSYSYTQAKLNYLEAEKTYKDGIKELERKYQEAVENVREEFENHLNDFYAPNGLKIDKSTVDLLHSGIKLKGKEIDMMISQYTGNPTMLRIISDYCEVNKIKDNRALSYGRTAAGYGHEEKKVFEEVAQMVATVSGVDEHKAFTWVDETNRNKYSEMVDGAVDTLDNYFIRPQTQTEGE